MYYKAYQLNQNSDLDTIMRANAMYLGLNPNDLKFRNEFMRVNSYTVSRLGGRYTRGNDVALAGNISDINRFNQCLRLAGKTPMQTSRNYLMGNTQVHAQARMGNYYNNRNSGNQRTSRQVTNRAQSINPQFSTSRLVYKEPVKTNDGKGGYYVDYGRGQVIHYRNPYGN